MEDVNISYLKSIARDSDNKDKRCTYSDKTIVELFYAQNNMNKSIRESFKLYELALWIIQLEKYRMRKNQIVTHRYYNKDIVYVNLGNNWGNELSYEHPCVILKSNYDKILVIPCSSSKIRTSRNENGDLYSNYL